MDAHVERKVGIMRPVLPVREKIDTVLQMRETNYISGILRQLLKWSTFKRPQYVCFALLIAHVS